MSNRILSCLSLCALVTGCGQTTLTAEQQFLSDVTIAMGGRDTIETAGTLVIEAEGTMLNIGQDLTPEAATMEFAISDYRRALDLDRVRSRTEMTRTPRFEYFRGPDPMRLAYGLDGDVAYSLAADGTARRAPDATANERRSLYYHHPLTLMHAAVSGTATVSNVREEAGHVLADFATTDGPVLTLAVDASTHRPAFIRSTDHHSYFRDVVRTTRFSGSIAAAGLELPATISESLEEFPVSELRVTAAEVGTASDLGAPEPAASAPAAAGPAPPTVSVEPLAEGVWLLAGQSHHSVLVEFSDHLLLIEAPNETRLLAVIAKAEELVPGKPVTHLVNTHHHFDHSGGLRAAVARGLTIVTQAANETFYRRMAEQPSSLVPDLLAEAPRAITLETVDDERILEDGAMRLELYHVQGSPHSRSMLMAYLPQQRLLVQVDLYTPGRSVPQTFAPNLLENIRRRGLEIDRVVPLHGHVIDFAELEDAVARLEAAG
jgi:glyoxylase-like metal-dependent hydrolase (beta-lactamase superfamily II)